LLPPASALQDARTAGRSGGDGVSWQTEVAAAAAASDCSGKAGIVEAPPADWVCVGEVAPVDGKSSDGWSDAGSGNAGHAAARSRRRVLMVSTTSTAV